MTDKNSVGIIIKDQSTGPYYCNSDNFKLHLQDKETEEYICPRCSTSYFPNLEKVKKGNKFETPIGRDHSDWCHWLRIVIVNLPQFITSQRYQRQSNKC